MARTSKTMLNNSRECRHPCLVSDFRGNTFSFSLLRIVFAVGLSYMAFIMLRCTELCLVAQSCPTLSDPMDCSPQGSSVHGDSPGKNTGVGCHALLQGIFPTQGLNPGLPHCKWILYQLSYQGSPNHHVYLDLFCDWKVPLCML